MINRAQLQAAYDLVEHLQGQGLQCVIAGGCARDIFFGVVPKDIDIIVVNTSREIVDDILAKGLYRNAYYPFYENCSDDRIEACWKLTGSNIDVILYDCEFAEQAIQAFDFNLNQFSLVGIHRGIDETVVRYQGTHPWNRFVPVRRDFTTKRLEYMMAKYHTLVLKGKKPPVGVHEVPVGGPYGLF